MNTNATARARTDGAESGRERGERCRAPNCWRRGVQVHIAGETVLPAVLCRRHRKAYFGVSS